MELAALMICLVVLIAVLVVIALWFGDRQNHTLRDQNDTLRAMCHVIGTLHAECPACGGRRTHDVVAGETIPQQDRQEPVTLLAIAPHRTAKGRW